MSIKSIIDASDYQKAARALKGAEKPIRLEYGRAVRAVAKPLGKAVLDEGAASLPQGGGLADRVAAAKVLVSATQLRAVISLKTAEGYDLKAMDRGKLRHPTYGHKPWVSQPVEAGAFTQAFEERAPAVRVGLLAAGKRALDRIAQEG